MQNQQEQIEETKRDSSLEELYCEYLQSMPLSTLRLLGRKYGTPSKAVAKQEIIDALIGILTGKEKAVPRSNRGAPVKQAYIDPAIIQRLFDIRSDYEAAHKKAGKNYLEVGSSDSDGNDYYSPPVYSGILEIMQSGYGFLRANNCQPQSGSDVFIPAPLIHSLKLRKGDSVTCTVKPKIKNESSAALDNIVSVNGLKAGAYEQRCNFDSLTAIYPNQKIQLSQNNSDPALRMLDLFSPIGRGQRALIIAPPKAGKTTVLKSIASSVASYSDLSLIVLLIDERPEEVTDFRTNVKGAEVIYSTFDEGAEHHIRAAELTLEHAKRLVEHGRHVVLLLDSITKLTRAYNLTTETSGRTLSGGLDANAFVEPKRFFGAARNAREGGSLTILATALIETGSRMDDVIYEEFKGTGNADIFLSRELAERRIFPAIDIRRSGTRKEELLLSREELDAVYKLRERGLVDSTENIIEMLKKTDNNEQFVARLWDWLKIYKVK